MSEFNLSNTLTQLWQPSTESTSNRSSEDAVKLKQKWLSALDEQALKSRGNAVNRDKPSNKKQQSQPENRAAPEKASTVDSPKRYLPSDQGISTANVLEQSLNYKKLLQRYATFKANMASNPVDGSSKNQTVPAPPKSQPASTPNSVTPTSTSTTQQNSSVQSMAVAHEVRLIWLNKLKGVVQPYHIHVSLSGEQQNSATLWIRDYPLNHQEETTEALVQIKEWLAGQGISLDKLYLNGQEVNSNSLLFGKTTI